MESKMCSDLKTILESYPSNLGEQNQPISEHLQNVPDLKPNDSNFPCEQSGSGKADVECSALDLFNELAELELNEGCDDLIHFPESKSWNDLGKTNNDDDLNLQTNPIKSVEPVLDDEYVHNIFDSLKTVTETSLNDIQTSYTGTIPGSSAISQTFTYPNQTSFYPNTPITSHANPLTVIPPKLYHPIALTTNSNPQYVTSYTPTYTVATPTGPPNYLTPVLQNSSVSTQNNITMAPSYQVVASTNFQNNFIQTAPIKSIPVYPMSSPTVYPPTPSPNYTKTSASAVNFMYPGIYTPTSSPLVDTSPATYHPNSNAILQSPTKVGVVYGAPLPSQHHQQQPAKQNQPITIHHTPQCNNENQLITINMPITISTQQFQNQKNIATVQNINPIQSVDYKQPINIPTQHQSPQYNNQIQSFSINNPASISTQQYQHQKRTTIYHINQNNSVGYQQQTQTVQQNQPFIIQQTSQLNNQNQSIIINNPSSISTEQYHHQKNIATAQHINQNNLVSYQQQTTISTQPQHQLVQPTIQLNNHPIFYQQTMPIQPKLKQSRQYVRTIHPKKNQNQSINDYQQHTSNFPSNNAAKIINGKKIIVSSEILARGKRISHDELKHQIQNQSGTQFGILQLNASQAAVNGATQHILLQPTLTEQGAPSQIQGPSTKATKRQQSEHVSQGVPKRAKMFIPKTVRQILKPPLAARNDQATGMSPPIIINQTNQNPIVQKLQQPQSSAALRNLPKVAVNPINSSRVQVHQLSKIIGVQKIRNNQQPEFIQIQVEPVVQYGQTQIYRINSAPNQQQIPTQTVQTTGNHLRNNQQQNQWQVQQQNSLSQQNKQVQQQLQQQQDQQRLQQEQLLQSQQLQQQPGLQTNQQHSQQQETTTSAQQENWYGSVRNFYNSLNFDNLDLIV